MATPKQVTFLYENLRLDWNLAQRLTVKEASEAIDSYKKIFNENPLNRHYAIRELVRKIEGKFTGDKCGMCGKRREPINSPESCSC